jgi:hypothetical protein
MPHVMGIRSEQRIVEVVLSGPIAEPEAFEMLAQCSKLQEQQGIPDALIDCTDVLPGLTYSSVVEMADYAVSLGVPSHWRQAVVKPRDLTAAVAVGLWAAAGGNRGMAIKVFPDRESALAWFSLG